MTPFTDSFSDYNSKVDRDALDTRIKKNELKTHAQASEDGTLTATFSIQSCPPQAGTLAGPLIENAIHQYPGIGLLGVRINNHVNHEFSIIPGLTEDLITFLLNLKKIKFNGFISGPAIVHLLVKGPKIITVSDLNLPQGVGVVDPFQYLARLYRDDVLDLELLIDYWVAYRSSEVNRQIVPDGYIPVDSVFSPILHAECFATSFRAHPTIIQTDAKTNREEQAAAKNLETESFDIVITTNGSVSPAQALEFGVSRVLTMFEPNSTEKELEE